MKKSNLLLFLLGIIALGLSAYGAAPKRPNILFILVDDQSPLDLKIYNPKSELDTPVIDRLASEGMVLDAAYNMGSWAGAVCTPSRHMIMSGRSVWHIPNKLGTGPVPDDLPSYTIGAVFNTAGFDTMRTCKRGNSYADANAQFTVVKDATKRGGTDESGSAWHGRTGIKLFGRTPDVEGPRSVPDLFRVFASA